MAAFVFPLGEMAREKKGGATAWPDAGDATKTSVNYGGKTKNRKVRAHHKTVDFLVFNSELTTQ